MQLLIILLILFFVNLIIYINFSRICEIIDVYDKPDKLRKFHKDNVSLLGGPIIFINLMIVIIISYFMLSQWQMGNKIVINHIFEFKTFYSFVVTSFFLFLVGFCDDKVNLNAHIKFILFVIIIFLSVTIDQSLILDKIQLSFSKNNYNLGLFAIPFTIVSFLLLINAINMFDGINTQLGLYSIVFIISFLINGFEILILISLLISVIFYLILNFYNMTFMGDSGSILIAYIFGYISIKYYNANLILYADEIFLLMLLPGLDLLRVSVTRLLNKKNIFDGDRIHIHHILFEKYGYFRTVLTIQFLIILPLLTSFITKNILLSILLGVFLYSLIFPVYLSKKINN